MSSMPRIALLMSSSAGYERGLLRGIARYGRQHGPWVFLLAGTQPGIPVSDATITKPRTKPARTKNVSGGRRCPSCNLRELGVTGIIGRLHSPRTADAVLASGLPAIAMDLTDEQLLPSSPLSRLSEIRPDSPKAGRLAAEHLLERGFRRFAFCGYPVENWSRWREEGFRNRLRESGFDCSVFQPRGTDSRVAWQRELPAVMAWLASLTKPVGLMTCNDVRGRQVVEACAMGGLHVPNDVAVVGVDEDHLLSELSNPPLSSVAFHAEQAGYRAAELLHRLMRGETLPLQRILVDALWVVPRLSTDVTAVEDRDVAAAVSFIRGNAREPIGVDDVVKQAAISRRALEIRFRRTLGRSIRDEIQRLRIGWAQQLLLETNLSVAKIAEAAGFSSLSYLSKVFRRAAGETLGEYRRNHRVP